MKQQRVRFTRRTMHLMACVMAGLSMSAQSDTIGISSTVNGHAVLSFMTAQQNVLIGKQAGDGLTTGMQNVLIGNQAGLMLTQANDNTALGFQAGRGLTLGYGNTFLGKGAGTNNAAGNRNTFVGTQAGLNNSSGDDNVYVGTFTGLNNVSGRENTAVGKGALNHADSIDGLTAVGYASLQFNTAYGNSAVGAYSLYLNQTGGNNSAFGLNANRANTTGSSNAAFGTSALFDNLGSYNVAIGASALIDNVQGEGNTAVGYNTGRLSIGSNNIFIGRGAGFAEPGDFKLHIENTSGGPGGPLVYGEFDNDYLRFNANASIRDDLLVGTTDKSNTSITMLFYDRLKGALRFGNVSDLSWQQDSLGGNSLAHGFNTRAIGASSSAFGLSSRALGDASVAIGAGTLAAGDYSLAQGFNSEAGANHSTAAGQGVIANGYGSFAVGIYNDPLTIVQTFATPATPLFMVGNGSSDSDRSNALIVRKSGLVEVPSSFAIGSGGTEVKELQTGTAVIGSHTGGVKTVSINFPSAFTTVPRVICTVRAGNFVDTFVVSTSTITTSGFNVNVFRVDNGGGNWGQNLELDWIATN